MTITLSDINTLDISDYNKFYENLKLGKSYGRGVFAGKNFSKNEIIEIAPFICDTKNELPFQDYIFSSHSKNAKSILVLGYGSVYNHSDNPNISYTLFHPTSIEPENAFFIYYANKDIKHGEELKISYGSGWWTSRKIKPQMGGGNKKSKRYYLRH